MAEIIWKGDLLDRIVVEAALNALREGGEDILTEAIDEAPILSGTLRRSGTVTVGGQPDEQSVYEAAFGTDGSDGAEQKLAYMKPLGTELSVYVSFNTPYARRQHEDAGLNHPIGGKSKYLEDPYKRKVNLIERLVGLRVDEALRKE